MIRAAISLISGALVLAVLAAPTARGEAFSLEFSAAAFTDVMEGGMSGSFFEAGSGYGFGMPVVGSGSWCTGCDTAEILITYTYAGTIDPLAAITGIEILNSGTTPSTFASNCSVISGGALVAGTNTADVFCTLGSGILGALETPYEVFLQPTFSSGTLTANVSSFTDAFGRTDVDTEVNVGVASSTSSPVPEPSSMVLGLTVLGLAIALRLKR
jgi:hypothetical protein